MINWKITEAKKCPDCSKMLKIKETFEDETYYDCETCGYQELVDKEAILRSILD